MRLAVKFFLAYSVVVLVLAGIAAWSLYEVAKLTVAERPMRVMDAEALRSAASLREAVQVAKRQDLRSLVFSDAEYAAASSAAADRIVKELENLGALVTTPAQKTLLARASEGFGKYQAAVTKARELRRAGDAKAAERILRKQAEPLVDRVTEDLDRLAAITRDVLDRAQAEATAALVKAQAEVESLRERTWKAVTTAMVLAVLAALVGTAIISIRVTRSLSRLSNATKAIAEGKFHEPLPVRGRDEIAELARSFNSMAARLREIDEMKEKFYSTVSHELRSPLNAMQEAAHLIEAKSAGPLTARQERLIAIFQKGTARLLRLVNGVLDLSRSASGTLPVERRMFAVESAVRQAVEELRPQAEQQGIALRAEIHSGTGNMLGDPDRVVQVLENLIGNALRFTPSGGSVTVSLRETDRDFRIEVSDTGIGIPAAFLSVIFDRFRQAHSGKGGTGLGLAIVKSLVEAHEGNVTVESQEGKGSRFTVSFPKETSSAATSEARAQHA